MQLLKKSVFVVFCLTLVSMLLFVSCSSYKEVSVRTNQSAKHVFLLMDSIQLELSAKGPLAWLHFFENTPEFFMASDGHLQFMNYDSAAYAVKTTLVQQIDSISLQWKSLRIDALSEDFAAVGSSFSEQLLLHGGKKISIAGYFTAIARRTACGWKIRNVHWSIVHPGT